MNSSMRRDLRVGVDGTLIRKYGKGISRFLISFLEAFALKPRSGIELVVFVAKGATLPQLPEHSQIQYVPIRVVKQIVWDLSGFERSLKDASANIAFTLSDRVNISHKYLLYYFEVPDYRFCANLVNAGWYQKISDRITRCFLERTLAKSYRIAASSSFTRNDLLNKYKVPENKVSTIHAAPVDMFKPCDDPDKQQMIRQKHGLENGYLLHFSSNNDPRDNTGTLLKAFSLSLNRLAHNHKLVICSVDKLGSFGWGETLHELGLEDQVVFTGFLSDEDLLGVYQCADVYVDTSLYEGFGFQVAEAMACGVPVICSGTSSLPEVAGDAAVYVDQNNEQEIADAIVYVLGDKQKMREMAEKSLKQAKKFSTERTTKEIVELLESY